MDQESQQDMETEGLDAQGAGSPRDMKRTTEPLKGQRTKRQATRPTKEIEVSLTEEYLEQISDVVTLA